MLFEHMCKMIHYIDLSYVQKLMEYDLEYAQQVQIPQKRTLQFLFLALIHKLHLTNMIRSLNGNYTAKYRNPVYSKTLV